MYLFQILYSSKSFCTLLLGVIAVVGDYLVFRRFNQQIYKSTFDSATHSLIGGFTWFIIVLLKQRNHSIWLHIKDIFLCALISSLIDLDHFWKAKSFSLKDAINLNGRPPLHCTSVPIIGTGLLILIAKYLLSDTILNFSWIFFTAFLTHHIRDGTRRGLWFYPFGSTPPIPYYLYVLITMFMPEIMMQIIALFSLNTKKTLNDSIFV